MAVARHPWRATVHAGWLLTVGTVAFACEAPGTDSYNPPPLPEGGVGGGTDGSGGDVSRGPVALPFVVSEEFQPTGAMGDSPMNIMAVSISSDSSQCPSPRVSGAVGTCYSCGWTPVLLPNETSAWAGLYWQYPGGNWGTMPGLPVAPGATKVTFAAAGAKGGEQVLFIAGGINTTPSDAGLTYEDQFKANTQVTLTKSWAYYEIPLTGDKYSTVLGGFAWTITAAGTEPIEFYVDDIEWQR